MSEMMIFDSNMEKTKPGSGITNGKRIVQQIPAYRLAKEVLELDLRNRKYSTVPKPCGDIEDIIKF